MLADVIAEILALLAADSRPFLNVQDLKAAVDAAARTSKHIDGKDPDFVVRAADWRQLSLAQGGTFAPDLKQDLDHTCLLNGVRFAVQRRFDVVIGNVGHGDRVVWAMLTGYDTEHEFKAHYGNASRNLDQAVGWLAHFGISAGPPVLVTSIEAHVRARLAAGSRPFLLFVAGRSTGADHTYVVYAATATPTRLELAVYDPWTGKNLDPTAATGRRADVIEADAFQMNFALPLSAQGSKDIPPGDATHYFVLTVEL